MADNSGSMKILVVDDEKLVRMVMSAKLKKAGYSCVAVGDVESAVTELKKAPKQFSAIITDIMMGEMDGFVFRDIVRGIASKIPIFFLTALDPEEGGGFLRRIMDDPISYYLPKAVSTDTLINRVRQVVASHRVEMFIQNKIEEDRKSMELAAHIQQSLLPLRSIRTPRAFYTMFWRPFDAVSGDLFAAIPFGTGCYMYVLGDIQGHGTSAALAMTAVQSYLKNFERNEGASTMGPEAIANMLQRFFRANLADVSYMTAVICIHRPLLGSVKWISCGAPDLMVMEGAKTLEINPEKRGGVPIGLFADTVYTLEDVVDTPLTRKSVCIAYTDGLLDLSRDAAGEDMMPLSLSRSIRSDLMETAHKDGTMPALPAMYIKALAELGYDKFHDDVTIVLFGANDPPPGMYETVVHLIPEDVDRASQNLAAWCREHDWPEEGISRIQVVLEEKLMNVCDHGFSEGESIREVVFVRMTRLKDEAVLTVWDGGAEEPSIAVVAGDSDTAFDKANKNMAGRGRGRLIVRELCDGIERKRYPPLNETTYHIPFFGKKSEE